VAQDPDGTGDPSFDHDGRDTLVDDEEVAAEGTSRLLLDEYGRTFTQGDVFFHEGDAATHAYLLHSGRVRLLKRVRTVERSIEILKAGDLFGEDAWLEGEQRMVTSVALSDGVAMVLDRSGLAQIAARFPVVSEQILIQLVRRLREAEDRVDILMLRDAPSKVISALLKLARSPAGRAELSVSPAQLSSRVGLDVDAVRRVVQRLRDQQYIRIIGERIEIPDLDALRRLYVLLGSKEDLRDR